MHALGTFVAQHLTARGWSQSELARRADISRQTVAKLLSGDVDTMGGPLDAHTYTGLAAALEVPVETVVQHMTLAMGLPGPTPPGPPEPGQAFADLQHALLGEGDLSADELLGHLSSVLVLADAIVGRVRALEKAAPAGRKGSVSSTSRRRGHAKTA